MMQMKLADGRESLAQWDTGRFLTVPDGISQVHFANKIYGRTEDVDAIDGQAQIPDYMLQSTNDLLAFGFVGTPENGYTKISRTFKVEKRPKPADYVFTKPEQITLQGLQDRIEAVEKNQDPDAIKDAVKDYLDKNPVEINEIDPTVPEWAKQPQKPKYTADEVGAQPKGNYALKTEIPAVPQIPEYLPNPHPLTLAGAVSATYDGSEPVNVKIPQGGGGGWELVNTIELSEDSNNVIIDQDSNGNSFELSAFMFYIDRVASELQESNSTLYVGNRGNGYFGQMQGQSPTQTRLWMSGEFMTNHMWRSVGGNGASGNFSASISYAGGWPTSAPMIRLYGYYFGAGTKIYLYGVRK